MPLFNITNSTRISRINPSRFDKEKQLQSLVEGNLVEIFGVRFIDSEFILRGEQSGRIDTLGLDLDGAPTIVEYKRSENESVINQGLYYMDWLLEHRGDFEVAALRVLGNDVQISWANPRLILLAQTFDKWDPHAVKRMGQGIELWTYTLYGADLLHLDLVYGQPRSTSSSQGQVSEDTEQYTVDDHLQGKPEQVAELYYSVRDSIFAWAQEEGEIIETPNKLYISYRHGRNFCEIEIQARALKITIDIPHTELIDPQNLARDVSDVGHWGTGETQVKLDSSDLLGYVMGLIEQAYRRTL